MNYTQSGNFLHQETTFVTIFISHKDNGWPYCHLTKTRRRHENFPSDDGALRWIDDDILRQHQLWRWAPLHQNSNRTRGGAQEDQEGTETKSETPKNHSYGSYGNGTKRMA
jgi:hypothetical protein